MVTREWLVENGMEDLLLADGFDEALVGYAQRPGQPPIAIYSREKCIDLLMGRDGLTFDEAEEFFDFNVAGAWVGERTPCFVVCPDADLELARCKPQGHGP